MEREKYLAYMKEYNKTHKRVKGAMSSAVFLDEHYGYKDLLVQPTQMNFKGSSEPRVCKSFGCRTILSLNELRFGERCINCQNQGTIDIAKYILSKK